MTKVSCDNRRTGGVVLAAISVLLWSTTSSCMVLGADRMPLWQFLALSSLLAGVTQFILLYVTRRSILPALVMPGKAWGALVGGIVLYGLVYPYALSSSRSTQELMTANLLNYLWPVLTVVFGVMIVPGVRLTAKLATAILISTFGICLVNYPVLRALHVAVVPFACALVAAVIWGLYSAVLVRWKDWVSNYATVPMGFTILGLICLATTLATGSWTALGLREVVVIFLAGVGPCGLGYACWELAANRGASPAVMGMLAASIPSSSTMLLCVVRGELPGIHVVVGAVLISFSVVLTVAKPKQGLGSTEPGLQPEP